MFYLLKNKGFFKMLDIYGTSVMHRLYVGSQIRGDLVCIVQV